MLKNTFLILSLITLSFDTISLTSSSHHNSSSTFKLLQFSSEKITKSTPRILLFTSFWGMGSVEAYHWNLQKLMAQHSFNHHIAVCKNSELHKKLTHEKINHYQFWTSFGEKNFEQEIRKQLRLLCKQKKFEIVQTHTFDDAKRALEALRGLPIKVIFMFHQEYDQPIKELDGISGVLALNHWALEFMKQDSKKNNLGIKHFKHLFLLPYKKKFINYRAPKESRIEYFKKVYDVTLTEAPVLCMVAQFYPPEKQIPSKYRKNQALLIQATAKLIYERNKPVHVLFAGSGPSQALHEQMSKDLGMEKYVHFLGYCKNTEDIFHYSDFHVLTSIGEALGAVYMEAGLIKKPSIGATGTGAEYLIADRKTGFLFKNNDVEDLTDKIEFLIDNPEMCKKMGQNAFDLFTGKKRYDKKNLTFLEYEHVKHLTAFYRRIMHSK